MNQVRVHAPTLYGFYRVYRQLHSEQRCPGSTEGSLVFQILPDHIPKSAVTLVRISQAATETLELPPKATSVNDCGGLPGMVVQVKHCTVIPTRASRLAERGWIESHRISVFRVSR
jgi:hypothetical protein